jgi:3-deoxy-manno-octulosonate cytidylyltransferase (CMP-KDO synthetase)
LRAVAVIPARHASARFPGKPLAPILGRPMVAWVVEGAMKAASLEAVWVATDSEEIAEAARRAGAKAAMTPAECPSGTDRMALVARQVDADVYVNVQGDEPLVEPADIDALVGALDGDPRLQMATLARPVESPRDLWSAEVVKVVCGRGGEALYFSRSPIPFYREAWSGDRARASGSPSPAGFVAPLRHFGLYAYRREALLAFPSLPRSALEEAECLEQLRALEAGWRIRVLPAQGDSIGVDRPEDLARAEEALRKRLQGSRREGGH